MGSAGSIAGGSDHRVIGTEYLKDSFDRNRNTLLTLCFHNAPADEVVYSDHLVYANTHLFYWLLEDIAEVRIKGLGELKYIDNTSGSAEIFCDLLDIPEIVSPIEVDADEFDRLGADIALCGCPKYALNAECLGIRDLNVYDLTTTIENPFNSQPVAVNVSNNQLNNEAFEKSQLSQSASILQLNIGGNALTTLPSIPLNLLFLDLSYSEELCFDTCGVFYVCPQLLRLVLDGCGLTNTVVISTEGDTSGSSIFVGLAKLQELSLKENMIKSLDNLTGLEYFSKKTPGGDFPMTLCSVNLVDNPVSESTAERKNIRDYITHAIPTVTVMDGKPVTASGGEVDVINKASVAYKDLHPVITDNDMITETMAQEFAAALKGEQDNTVVS